jgi:hypothetical protein
MEAEALIAFHGAIERLGVEADRHAAFVGLFQQPLQECAADPLTTILGQQAEIHHADRIGAAVYEEPPDRLIADRYHMDGFELTAGSTPIESDSQCAALGIRWVLDGSIRMLFTIVSRAAVSKGAPECVRSKSIALRSANLNLCNFVHGIGAPG